MYSRLRYTNSYGLRILSETELLIAHVFSYKINSNICVIKEIWLIQPVKEGMRDTDINFIAYKVDVYELNIKVILI